MEILKKTSGARDAPYSRRENWAIRYLHRVRYFPIFSSSASSTLSLRSGEAQTQENKKCTGYPIKPLPNCFVPMQSFAEGRAEPRENEAPDCAGGHKCESEKKQRHFRVQDVGQNSLPKRCPGRAPPKVGRQTQMLSPIEHHFDSEKNQISAAEQFDRTKGER